MGSVTAKASAEDLLRLNNLTATKTAFSTPKRYDEQARLFYMGDPHWGRSLSH